MNVELQKMPAVSVVLPVYNGGRYLHQAIDSVLRQTFEDFELILINDGSTDESGIIIRDFASSDARVILIERENRGLIESLNEGLNASRGELVARMDADDVCRPNRFAMQVAYMQAHPECIALGSRIQLIDPEGLPIKEMGSALHHEVIDADYMQGRCSFFHPTVMFRRAGAIKIGGYQKEFKHAEDVDFFLRLAEQGCLANLPDVLLEYRQHMQSVGYAHASSQTASTQAAVTAARLRRGTEIHAKAATFKGVVHEQSPGDVYRKWAWWSLAGRNLSTAKKHLINAFRVEPFAKKNWRLFLCVLRGH